MDGASEGQATDGRSGHGFRQKGRRAEQSAPSQPRAVRQNHGMAVVARRQVVTVATHLVTAFSQGLNDACCALATSGHVATAPPIAYAWFRKSVFQVRTHLALGKDTPLGRAVQRCGVIVAYCTPDPSTKRSKAGEQ